MFLVLFGASLRTFCSGKYINPVSHILTQFLNRYLLDLKAPKYLLGLTLTVGAVIGLPFLHSSEWFMDKAGRVNLLILAQFVYMIRFVGYSFIQNPWFCIPFEAMEAFTLHLMWVAAVTYAASLTPPGLTATIQGTVGSIHYGVGRGLGSFIGGGLMAAFGARIAFRSMGIGAGVCAIVYATFHYSKLICRKLEQRLDIDELPKGRTSIPNIDLDGSFLSAPSVHTPPSVPVETHNLDVICEDEEYKSDLDDQQATLDSLDPNQLTVDRRGSPATYVRRESVISISSINKHNPKPFLA